MALHGLIILKEPLILHFGVMAQLPPPPLNFLHFYEPLQQKSTGFLQPPDAARQPLRVNLPFE